MRYAPKKAFYPLLSSAAKRSVTSASTAALELNDRAQVSISISPQLEIDEHGAPVTLGPGYWFICFVPGLKRQWWHPLVHKRHKHVFAIRPESNGTWTLFEPWWRRLLTASVTLEQARRFLIWGAAGEVLLVREDIPGRGSQVRGWMTCAGLVSYLLGRPYCVWTPHHLYRLLLRERNACLVDMDALLALDTIDFVTIAHGTAGRPPAQKHRLLPFFADRGKTGAAPTP